MAEIGATSSLSKHLVSVDTRESSPITGSSTQASSPPTAQSNLETTGTLTRSGRISKPPNRLISSGLV